MGLRRRGDRNTSWESSDPHGHSKGRDPLSPVVSPEGLGAFPISSVSGLSPSAIGVVPLPADAPLSTPLDADTGSEESIPTALWWAMKDRKHHHGLLEDTAIER